MRISLPASSSRTRPPAPAQPGQGLRLAELSQLTRDISRPLGVLWLLAALALLASLGSFFSPRAFPWLGLGALLLSQVVICTSWSDARFGTLANVLCCSP